MAQLGNAVLRPIAFVFLLVALIDTAMMVLISMIDLHLAKTLIL